jgi:glycosyltransferase involved in cell wall biosynthesis
MPTEPRIALVHDYWVTLRGGERVFLALTRLFPQADCYALIAPRRHLPAELAQVPLQSSFLSFLPGSYRYYRTYLPLYPLAARSLNLKHYDLVITSSSGFTQRVQTRGVHICYCHTPLRYAWNEFDATLAQQRPPITRALLAGILRGIRRSDVAAAQHVSAFIANSRIVQARIAAYYQRQSDIVYPPVAVERFAPQTQPGAYFLVVSHLHPYKRVDLAVEACTRLRLPLVVVGVGPERARLEAQAGPTVRFLGRVAEGTLPELYEQCRALLQCGEEDFGIAALEVQASGRPVIAFGQGGAGETVIDGITGVHFHEQSVAAVMQAIMRCQNLALDPFAARRHAEQFDETHFQHGIQSIVAREMQQSSTLPMLTPVSAGMSKGGEHGR